MMRILRLPLGSNRHWPRIFVDCTQTAACPVSTGIPRVVRNIIAFGAKAARERGVELVPVRFQHGEFRLVATMSVGGLVSPSSPRQHPLATRLRKILVPRTLVRNMSKLSGWFPPDQPPCAAVTFAAGDVLLLPDSSWAEDMWAAVDRARQAGVALGVVQHDFIPIRHPELVPPKSTKIFRKWMEATLGRADFVMAVSQSVAAETRAELLRLGRAEVARCGVSSFRNGADFLDEADVQPPVAFRRSAAIRQSLVDFLHGGTAAPYLTVGTIEPRKNQSLLLQAIDRVRAEAPDARFLLAGLIGWEGQLVVDALRNHAAWGRAILHIPDLDDAELKYAYRHARALVFPSLAEGYGLPIVEAFARNLRVFAADIPVHREIGGGSCVYFDPHDPGQLADLLIAFSRSGRFAAAWPPRRSALPTWAEAAEQIVATALKHAQLPLPIPVPQPAWQLRAAG
jgi:alpha-1,2-rhamnosyltransferase